ncbi:MAG: glutaminase [Chitinophagaceae bacterium]|nr:glutaminase [Rubrivivax sp.]
MQGVTHRQRPRKTIFGGAVKAQLLSHLQRPTNTRRVPCSGCHGEGKRPFENTILLCVWSPALDASGNSWLGMRALEMFVARTNLSVF